MVRTGRSVICVWVEEKSRQALRWNPGMSCRKHEPFVVMTEAVQGSRILGAVGRREAFILCEFPGHSYSLCASLESDTLQLIPLLKTRRGVWKAMSVCYWGWWPGLECHYSELFLCPSHLEIAAQWHEEMAFTNGGCTGLLPRTRGSISHLLAFRGRWHSDGTCTWSSCVIVQTGVWHENTSPWMYFYYINYIYRQPNPAFFKLHSSWCFPVTCQPLPCHVRNRAAVKCRCFAEWGKKVSAIKAGKVGETKQRGKHWDLVNAVGMQNPGHI